jgi:hypothetical protein
MYISLTNSGFNKWSKDHRSSNDNDDILVEPRQLPSGNRLPMEKR